jgi:16S rRNA A1518/A1519 N6-dimethyltransferase RsmA/KsgA/DIM1 with predicted DNA glycosylase/AP lyase activity
MCPITETIESWMTDPTKNVIEPGSGGAAFTKPLATKKRG